MSLLASIILATRCSSNHHRIAVEALGRLSAPDAALWRDVFLHHHADFLKGAKAPDDTFKDFKNHVLHVRDGEWGGAIEAAEEWRRRTERALAAKDWRHAAWCAGVMSHYIADPIQPFHTHQTEEENVIHRAVEWSFAKSHKDFTAVLARDGYPQIAAPQGESWLADLIREGARTANAAYETVIDHYDFAVGVKNPPAGLDDTLRAAIAPLYGRAILSVALALDRTIAAAGVAPPRVDGTLQAFFLALETPIQVVLAAIGDARERSVVAAQYEEFRRTGKVRDTLSEDDKAVRALFAAEVLKTPLSSLDAKWPRETGAKHAPPQRAQKSRAQTAKAEKPPKPLKPAKAEKPAPAPKSAPVAKPAPKPAPIAMPAFLSAPAPRTEPMRVADAPAPKRGLAMTSPVVDAPSIGPKTARRLEAKGVRTIGDLLALQPATGAVLIDQKHISAQLIQDWQAQARLALAAPGLRSREAQALVGCGVRDAGALIESEPAMLAEAALRWAQGEEGKRVWGDAPLPDEALAARWIADAKSARLESARPGPAPVPGKKKSAA